MVASLLLTLALMPARAQTAPDVSTVTLRQVYDWALQRSEALKSRDEDVEQSRQRAKGAMAGAFPRLDWELVDTWQDPVGVNRLSDQGFGGFVQKEQQESRLALRQPLFSGLREFSAWSGFLRQQERDTLRALRARKELFETVATSYYGVLGREAEAANTSDGLSLAQDRATELHHFLRLGKARESELFTALARAAALRASLRRSQADVASARQELSFLAGRDLALTPLSSDAAAAAPPTLESALAQSRERADVRAQREDVAASERQVRYEKGSYWPSLDLLGRYYTRRATFMKEIGWDVGLSLDVPIFQGGRVNANVKRARSAQRQSQLALDELQRRVDYEVRRLHGELLAAVEEAQAQEESAQAAQKSYDALREEYTLGLVTNLDVLQALDLLLSQKRARDASRLDVDRLAIRLGVATESLP